MRTRTRLLLVAPLLAAVLTCQSTATARPPAKRPRVERRAPPPRDACAWACPAIPGCVARRGRCACTVPAEDPTRAGRDGGRSMQECAEILSCDDVARSLAMDEGPLGWCMRRIYPPRRR